jgi:hypothetical protein
METTYLISGALCLTLGISLLIFRGRLHGMTGKLASGLGQFLFVIGLFHLGLWAFSTDRG